MGGRALLAEPVKPSFFRAPTDNDLGGSNNVSFAVRCASLCVILSACTELCVPEQLRGRAALVLSAS